MALLDEILHYNAGYVAGSNPPAIRLPDRKIALLTYTDTCPVDVLESALGLWHLDVRTIDNAVDAVIDSNSVIMHHLITAVFASGCEEILVVGYHDDSVAQLDEQQVQQRMLERGVDPGAVATLLPSLRAWLSVRQDPKANVRRLVAMIRQSPLIPADMPIHGLMFDQQSGSLEVLVNGYA